MIAFDFNWSDPLNLALILFLCLLGVLQIWLLKRNLGSDNSGKRAGFKIGLHLLLWVVISAFVLQPLWRSHVDPGNIMVADAHVPFREIKRIQDSLHVREVLSAANFTSKNFDTLTLVGQDFSPSFFAKLARTLPISALVRWVPFFRTNQIESISWKGVVRKGQLQQVRGVIHVGASQWIRLKFGNQTLDSLWVVPGRQAFDLRFPVFTEKRTNIALFLGDEKLGLIQFFAQPLSPMNFRFVLDNPDFESRNLATWLANRGHSVTLSTDLSKNIRSTLTLNTAGEPDIMITDPKNASEPQVKKAVLNGKSILFINLTNPTAEVTAINASLGTKFQVKKISNEETVPVLGEVAKLPFAFAQSNVHSLVSKWPVAVEKTAGKVAISLLSETFPALLSGDSVTYGNIWTSVLAAIHPAYQTNMEVDAPVYKGMETSFRFNNLPKNPKYVTMGHDTLYLNYSAVNAQTGQASYIPLGAASWLRLHDEVEIAVADSLHFNSYYQGVCVENFVKARQKLQSGLDGASKLADTGKRPHHEVRVPDWIWFLALIFCFTALWLEPKFS